MAPPRDGESLSLQPDLDSIEALSTERESLWRRVTAASFLTTTRSARLSVTGGAESEALRLSGTATPGPEPIDAVKK